MDVVQAEPEAESLGPSLRLRLHLYKSRVHGHSPTPPRMKKWHMRWAGMCHFLNEREPMGVDISQLWA